MITAFAFSAMRASCVPLSAGAFHTAQSQPRSVRTSRVLQSLFGVSAKRRASSSARSTRCAPASVPYLRAVVKLVRKRECGGDGCGCHGAKFAPCKQKMNKEQTVPKELPQSDIGGLVGSY